MAPRPDTGQPAVEFVEAVFTCTGDYYDPDFPKALEQLNQKLFKLLNTERDRLIVKKVEPWNSVKVTVNIPKDAAEKLKSLASLDNGSELRKMGILSLQTEGGKIISLTLASPQAAAAVTPVTISGISAASASSSSAAAVDTCSSSTSLNHLLNLSYASNGARSSSSADLNNSLSGTSLETSPSAKPKAAERRQRKTPANKSRSRANKKPTVPGSSATSPSASTTAVVNSVETSVIRSGITMNNITDLVESAFNAEEQKISRQRSHDGDSASGSAELTTPAAVISSAADSRPTVIHPALRDTPHDLSLPATTTVTVTGATDRQAVNSLVASMFSRSLAAVAAASEASGTAVSKLKTDSNIDTAVATGQLLSNSSSDRLSPLTSTEFHGESMSVLSPQRHKTPVKSPPAATDATTHPVTALSPVHTENVVLDRASPPEASIPEDSTSHSQTPTSPHTQTQNAEEPMDTSNSELTSAAQQDPDASGLNVTTPAAAVMHLSVVTRTPAHTSPDTQISPHQVNTEADRGSSPPPLPAEASPDDTHQAAVPMDVSDVAVDESTVAEDSEQQDVSEVVNEPPDEYPLESAIDDGPETSQHQQQDVLSPERNTASSEAGETPVVGEEERVAALADVEDKVNCTESDDHPESGGMEEEKVDKFEVDNCNKRPSLGSDTASSSLLSRQSSRVSQDSQDSAVLPNKKLMINCVVNDVRSPPSDSILISPSYVDEEEAVGAGEESNSQHAILTSSVSSYFIEAPVSTTTASISEGVLLAKSVEEEDGRANSNPETPTDPTTAVVTLPTVSDAKPIDQKNEEKQVRDSAVLSSQTSLTSSSTPDAVIADTSENQPPSEVSSAVAVCSREAEAVQSVVSGDNTDLELKPFRSADSSLYSLGMVTAELPDELLEDDEPSDVAPSSSVSQVDTTDEVEVTEVITKTAPVSVIKSPITVQTVEESVTETVSQVSSVVTECSKQAIGGDAERTSVRESLHVSRSNHSAPTITTTVLHHQQHTQVLSEHEPVENGSSTSTDSGVVPGSPKSDICATPPSVEDGHHQHLSLKSETSVGVSSTLGAGLTKNHVMSADIVCSMKSEEENTTTSSTSVTVSTIVTSPAVTNSQETATPSAVSPAQQLVMSSASENRPCVSILKTVKPVTTAVIGSSDAHHLPVLKTITTKVISREQKVQQLHGLSLTASPTAFNLVGQKEQRQLRASEVILAAASKAQQQQRSALSQAVVSSAGDQLVSLISHQQLLATASPAHNATPATYVLHGKELVMVDKEVVHSPKIITSSLPDDTTNSGPIKPAYIIARDKGANHHHIINAGVRQPHILKQQVSTPLQNIIVPASRDNNGPNHRIVVSSASPTLVNEQKVRDDWHPILGNRSHIPGLPTNLPPVTIINSRTVKNCSKTTVQRNSESISKSVTMTHEQVSCVSVPAVASPPQQQPHCDKSSTVSSSVGADVPVPVEPPSEVKDVVATKESTTMQVDNDKSSGLDNGKSDPVAVNGSVEEHDAENEEDTTTVKIEEENKLNVQVEEGGEMLAEVAPSLVSPNSQQPRKSGRTRKSPDLDLPYEKALVPPTPKGRKRRARQMSESSNQSENKDETINSLTSAPPTAKRANQKPSTKVVELSTPASPPPPPPTANGPTRTKRATRSSGVKDLQSLPTVYRDRGGKRTKR